MAKSDVTRAFAEDGTNKTHIGGQALIEGVMMRGRSCWGVAVREPNNRIHTELHQLQKKRDSGWRSWPLVRGCVALVDSLAIGFKALEIAANHALEDEDEAEARAYQCEARGNGAEVQVDEPGVSASAEACDGGAEMWSGKGKAQLGKDRARTDGAETQSSKGRARAEVAEEAAEEAVAVEESNAFGKGAMAVSMVMGIVLGIALFMVLPAFVSNLLVGDYDTNSLAWNLVDGVCRVAVFVFYVWLIGRMKDIKRMFAYHGAEHKTIHCYEHGLALTPENAQQFPRLHVRCGTAFLIMVMIIAILVYTIIPLDAFISAAGITNSAAKFLLVLAVRLLFVPVIAGISYEITVKWAGSHPENLLVHVVLWPGMQMQRLTTNEPDAGQLECAIAAMDLVLAQEERADEGLRASSSACSSTRLQLRRVAHSASVPASSTAPARSASVIELQER